MKENTRKRKLPLRPWDFVIIGIALVLTGYSAFAIYIKPRNTAQVLIQGPAQQWIYPLDAEETIAVQGPLGNTVVRIHNGEAWVESSPCDNQTCVATGHLNGTGLWAACLPNNVFLVIEGYDAIRELTDSGAW